MFDEAKNQASRHIFSLQQWSLHPLIWSQVSSSLYLVNPSNETFLNPQAQDKRFHGNNAIWEALISNQLKRTDLNIILDSFFIFEWIPRSPGLYYTEEGQRARKEASSRIISIDNKIVVYDPYGKQSMLDGGVGNIRIKPIMLEGNEYHFMTASANGVCHEGVPVAIPSKLYNDIIEEISGRGVVVRDLIGKLKLVPDELTNLYRGIREVPKCYIKVESLTKASNPSRSGSVDLNVSVAVSFLSRFEGHNRIYATYVTFDPASKVSFKENLRWMEYEYVTEKYKGKVITDFDQIMSHFPNATFSMEKIMTLNLNADELSNLGDDTGLNFFEILQLQTKLKVNLTVNNMGDEYNISGGQQANVGPHGNVSNLTQNQNILSQVDMHSLIEELEKLRLAAKKQAVDVEHDKEVGVIAAAQDAAKKGDKPKLLQHLASAGKWTLDIATKIGTTLAASVIKEAIGLK